jgi:glycogen debranching enzyme
VTEWHEKRGELHTSYSYRDFDRRFIYRLRNSGWSPAYANGRITFEIDLEPGATWHACGDYLLVQGARIRASRRSYAPEHHDTAVDRLQRQWLSQATALTSANEDVYRQYRQAVEDMGALRLFDHDFAPDIWVPAAGVPWFVTIFGRDSLMVSLQNMLVHAGNAGHALWSGIASAEHAAQVVARLLQPDMWSGWGIWTLAASNPAYNPFAYQRGSVWPHDNGIIALGFKRHGFAAEAARVFRDISEAASYFVGYWPPEL